MNKVKAFILGTAVVSVAAYRAAAAAEPAPATAVEPEPLAAPPAPAPTLAVVADEPAPVAAAPQGVAAERFVRPAMLAVVALLAPLAALHKLPHFGINTIVLAVLALLIVAAVVVSVFPHRTDSGAPAAAAPSSPGHSTRRMKLALVFLLAIGIAAYFGNSGTFGSFSAETTNPGSGIASGTLTMSNAVTNLNTGVTATACLSANAATLDNSNSACDKLFNLSNLKPGAPSLTGAVMITVKNTGSIDAPHFWLWAPNPNASLGSTLSTGGAITSLPITSGSLEGTITAGDKITVSSGPNSQQFTVTGGPYYGAASPAVTSIGITSVTPNYAYPSGSRITDPGNTDVGGTLTNFNVSNTDCFDRRTTDVGPSPHSPNVGTDLNFNQSDPLNAANVTASNPLCNALILWVQESSVSSGPNASTKFYCWSGSGAGVANNNSNAGLCRAPISVALTSGATTAASQTLAVTALNGNVLQSDTIVITDPAGTSTLSCSAGSGIAYTAGNSSTVNATPIGSTSIGVTGCTETGTASSFPTGSTVVDTSAQGTLNLDTTDTVSKFDRDHPPRTGLELKPLSTSVTGTTLSAGNELASGSSRYYYVGVYFPNWTSAENQLQGLQSTFGLSWHLDQS